MQHKNLYFYGEAKISHFLSIEKLLEVIKPKDILKTAYLSKKSEK